MPTIPIWVVHFNLDFYVYLYWHLYFYLCLYLYCICLEIARNTSVPTRTCLHAHLTAWLPSTAPSLPCHRLKDKKEANAWKMPLRRSFVCKKNHENMPKRYILVLKMPLQQIPAEKKVLVFCELAEWWSLVSPNRVLLAGLRKCPRIVCPTSQGCTRVL